MHHCVRVLVRASTGAWARGCARAGAQARSHVPAARPPLAAASPKTPQTKRADGSYQVRVVPSKLDARVAQVTAFNVIAGASLVNCEPRGRAARRGREIMVERAVWCAARRCAALA
jgi:hypothetical protein